MTTRILLDTSSLMYRAFFSTPPTVTSPAGEPVNAIHGYLDMTSRLVGSRRPDRLVPVYDHDWRAAPPGAHGVGEKTARLLVQASPSLDALVADAKSDKRAGAPLQRSPSLRTAIRDAADYLEAMRKIVPIRTDIPVREWEHPRDDAKVEELSERYAVGGPVRRLHAAMAGARSREEQA